MTTTAKSIIYMAQDQLHDLAGIRWPATDLVQHLNDGLVALAEIRPDATAKTISHSLVAGVKQTVPAGCLKLMDITRNTSGAPIRQTQQQLLDDIDPNWYSRPGSTRIRHFYFDERDPKTFYVYPPAATGASVELLHSAAPAVIPAPSGRSYDTVTGDLPVADAFKSGLWSFVLFRAYSKDAQYGGNSAMSLAHYQLFMSLKTSGDGPSTEDAKPKVKDSTAVTG